MMPYARPTSNEQARHVDPHHQGSLANPETQQQQPQPQQQQQLPAGVTNRFPGAAASLQAISAALGGASPEASSGRANNDTGATGAVGSSPGVGPGGGPVQDGEPAVGEDEVCWLCLGGPDDGYGPLVAPCRCPRVCHPGCLSRWQLHCAGRQEEKLCRFCGQELPDWRYVPPVVCKDGNMGPTAPPPPAVQAPPAYMRISYSGRSHKIRVWPGPDGTKQFIEDCRQLLKIPTHLEFDVVFHCKEPATQSDLRFRGLDAFDAAVYCASLANHAATQQQQGQQSTQQASNTNAQQAQPQSDLAGQQSQQHMPTPPAPSPCPLPAMPPPPRALVRATSEMADEMARMAAEMAADAAAGGGGGGVRSPASTEADSPYLRTPSSSSGLHGGGIPLVDEEEAHGSAHMGHDDVMEVASGGGGGLVVRGRAGRRRSHSRRYRGGEEVGADAGYQGRVEDPAAWGPREGAGMEYGGGSGGGVTAQSSGGSGSGGAGGSGGGMASLASMAAAAVGSVLGAFRRCSSLDVA